MLCLCNILGGALSSPGDTPKLGALILVIRLSAHQLQSQHSLKTFPQMNPDTVSEEAVSLCSQERSSIKPSQMQTCSKLRGVIYALSTLHCTHTFERCYVPGTLLGTEGIKQEDNGPCPVVAQHLTYKQII